jgi:acetyl esterase/lipase
VSQKPGVLLFIHGGVWIVGNFQNHQRLLRDLVVGSGQIGVFVEYTPLPTAKFPTQLEECYAALKWVSEHAGELGADGSRIAVAGNSVGGNMTAALTLMTKDRSGPKISYQALLIPATDASVDTESYHEYSTGRFLARGFHEVWMGALRPRREDAQQSLCFAAPRQHRPALLPLGSALGAVIPDLVPGIHLSACSTACGWLDPGDKPRDDKDDISVTFRTPRTCATVCDY